jgi:hypothetical protein
VGGKGKAGVGEAADGPGREVLEGLIAAGTAWPDARRGQREWPTAG